MMNMSKNIYRKPVLLLSIIALGSTLVACESMQGATGGNMTSSQTSNEMSVEKMTEMAMGNMQKIMMLSPADQQQYVMDVQQQSLNHGQQLFSDAGLGSNGFSCATCHPAGKTTGGKVPMGKMKMGIPTLIGASATFPKFKAGNDAVITVAEMNNNCVVMFLKGEPLPLGSASSRDLSLYVTSLSKGESIMPGKQSM